MPDPAPVQVTVTGTIGALKEFNAESDDWSIYAERLEQYFMANNIPDTRKVPVLLTLIGDKAYATLRDLCDPVLPKTKDYDALCALLSKQFSPHVSAFRKRIEFYHMSQEADETVSQWYARLKNAAIPCSFGADLKTKLSDRFVTGLRPGPVLDRLCEEDTTKTLEDLVDLAVKREATFIQQQPPAIHKLSSRSSGNQGRSSKSGGKKKKRPTDPGKNSGLKFSGQSSGATYENAKVLTCNHCGGIKHDFAKCKYKAYKCNHCKVTGHIAKACKKKNGAPADSNFLGESKFSEACSDKCDLNDYVNMFQLDGLGPKPLIAPVLINNVPIQMEIDSGSGRTVIPYDLYLKHFKFSGLSPSSIVLRTYSGQLITPVGEFKAQVLFKGAIRSCGILVVKEGSRPLMGRDLIIPWQETIFKVEAVSAPPKFLIDEFPCLFSKGLGRYKFDKIDLKLNQEVTKPIFCHPRKVPYSFLEKVEQELLNLEKQGVLVKVDTNPWGTPLVPVLKPDGNIRVCADYKVTVNKFLDDFHHPIPLVEDLFTKLKGGESYTKLDFSNAYNQLEVTEETSKLLAWSTHKGTYLVKLLPFGTKPACNIFQQIVEKVLEGCKCTVNFMDDVVVTGVTRQNHIDNLREVFKRLSEAGFKLNLLKCEFFKPSVTYLGHVISKDGLSKDPSKVDSILNASKPRDVHGVRAFVGMVNYYSKFLPNLASLLKPLYALLRKGQRFIWTQDCEDAFIKVKEAMASDQFLVHYDPKLPVKLMCDSSSYGLGAALVHIFPDGTERPICFVSRTLSRPEINYSVIDREALAIYWSLKKFYQYLMGRHFILCTDHKPLLALFGDKTGIPIMAAGRLQRWALFLSGFNYSLEYIKGSDNCVADCLSRIPSEEGEIDFCEVLVDYLNFMDHIPVDFLRVRVETKKDSVLSQISHFIKTGWPESVKSEDLLHPYFLKRSELNLDHGVIMWGYRAVIPESLRETVLNELHQAHLGMSKMKSVARSYFYWPKLDQDIETLVKSCDMCMKSRANPKESAGSWPEAKSVFERVHIDFATLHKVHYLVLVDAFSKWVEIIEMPVTDSVTTEESLKDVFARFGMPGLLVSDNGPPFNSSQFALFCERNGIKFLTSPPFHPPSNGLAENAVKSFKASFSKMLADPGNKGVSPRTLLTRYLLNYRNAPHVTTGIAPAQMIFKHKVRTRWHLLVDSKAAMPNDKVSSSESVRGVNFNEGDIVYVKDHRNPNKPCFVRAKILEPLGNKCFIVHVFEENLIWKRHVDQIIKGPDSPRFYGPCSSNNSFPLPVPSGTSRIRPPIVPPVNHERVLPVMVPNVPQNNVNVPTSHDIVPPIQRDVPQVRDKNLVTSHETASTSTASNKDQNCNDRVSVDVTSGVSDVARNSNANVQVDNDVRGRPVTMHPKYQDYVLTDQVKKNKKKRTTKN